MDKKMVEVVKIEYRGRIHWAVRFVRTKGDNAETASRVEFPCKDEATAREVAAHCRDMLNMTNAPVGEYLDRHEKRGD